MIMPCFSDILYSPSREEEAYTLNIKILKTNKDSLLSNIVLEGSSKFDYSSQVQEAINNLIPIFGMYFGYIVDYTIKTDVENKTYCVTFNLKDKIEDEEPIDPPEEDPEEPTDPEEGDNSENLEDATDENSHI